MGLYLQSLWAVSEDDEALEEGLREPCLGRPLAHDDGPELAVVPHHDELLGTHDDGDETLGLHGLRRLIHQHLGRGGRGQGGGVKEGHTRRVHKDGMGEGGKGARAEVEEGWGT